jgi:hypothetical protein
MGVCRFIHPDQDGWERAASSEPPPRAFLHEDDWPVKRHSDYRLESPESDGYSPTRPRTGPKRRSHHNYDMSPPRRDSTNYSRRSRSPAVSTSSRDPGPSRRTTDPKRIPLAPSRDENMPIEPLVPPPPLPPPPSVTAAEKALTDSTPNKEPPAADKREVWLERIK